MGTLSAGGPAGRRQSLGRPSIGDRYTPSSSGRASLGTRPLAAAGDVSPGHAALMYRRASLSVSSGSGGATSAGDVASTEAVAAGGLGRRRSSPHGVSPLGSPVGQQQQHPQFDPRAPYSQSAWVPMNSFGEGNGEEEAGSSASGASSASSRSTASSDLWVEESESFRGNAGEAVAARAGGGGGERAALGGGAAGTSGSEDEVGASLRGGISSAKSSASASFAALQQPAAAFQLPVPPPMAFPSPRVSLAGGVADLTAVAAAVIAARLASAPELDEDEDDGPAPPEPSAAAEAAPFGWAETVDTAEAELVTGALRRLYGSQLGDATMLAMRGARPLFSRKSSWPSALPLCAPSPLFFIFFFSFQQSRAFETTALAGGQTVASALADAKRALASGSGDGGPSAETARLDISAFRAAAPQLAGQLKFPTLPDAREEPPAGVYPPPKKKMAFALPLPPLNTSLSSRGLKPPAAPAPAGHDRGSVPASPPLLPMAPPAASGPGSSDGSSAAAAASSSHAAPLAATRRLSSPRAASSPCSSFTYMGGLPAPRTSFTQSSASASSGSFNLGAALHFQQLEPANSPRHATAAPASPQSHADDDVSGAPESLARLRMGGGAAAAAAFEGGFRPGSFRLGPPLHSSMSEGGVSPVNVASPRHAALHNSSGGHGGSHSEAHSPRARVVPAHIAAAAAAAAAAVSAQHAHAVASRMASSVQPPPGSPRLSGLRPFARSLGSGRPSGPGMSPRSSSWREAAESWREEAAAGSKQASPLGSVNLSPQPSTPRGGGASSSQQLSVADVEPVHEASRFFKEAPAVRPPPERQPFGAKSSLARTWHD